MKESCNLEENIVQILQQLGEDPNREGLRETPSRVVRSMKELYAGYKQDPSKILKTFTECDGYQQVVVSKNIKIFSMCEHHMLPFYGRAHVAYLPKNRIVGISKLARLVHVFSRRLQIQERLCEQITNALMMALEPQGAACIIEARHMCMQMRGCNEQDSTMITSSLKGSFLEDQSIRIELLSLIKLNENV